jgi:hypothetical protein
MVDVALSLLALVAGGFSLELFTTAARSSSHEEAVMVERFEEIQIGNPS